MPSDNLPYVVSTGSLTKALSKIQSAATPDRFTQDFLSTKLGLKGGGAKAVIPYFKRLGLLGSDGTPTETYRKFRNSQSRGVAASEAIRTGYTELYQANEYAHELTDDELRGLIVQITGVEEESRVLTATVGSFKAVAEHADFDSIEASSEMTEEENLDDMQGLPPVSTETQDPIVEQLNLGYTINLHLPPTSDIAVFNAIFKSLRENLLR